MSQQSRTLSDALPPSVEPKNSAMSIFSKTSAFLGISALRDLVTDSMAIDMGTANTIIAVNGRDVVLDEPSLIAVNELTNELVAFGQEAYEMRGREARDVKVIAPLIGGVVADFERTKQMLAHFVTKGRSGVSQFSRRAVMSVISEITHVEQRALLDAVESAHVGKVFMMEEGLAAAFGAGISPHDKRASAVVDIGSSTTNIAVVANGTIVHSRSERLGSSSINAAIINHVRRHRGLAIGDETAEKLKLEVVSATLPTDIGFEIMIRGRDVQTGSPGAVTITAGELYPVAEGIIRRVSNSVNQALTELGPEVAADIYDRGIILTGGGALFSGIESYMRARTKLPVLVADEPRYSAVRGLLQMFNQPMLLRRVARNEPHLLSDADIPFEV
ncbi:MAG: rod shape-determining protein [Pyrinomonadaceae bacterium]|nr:rod shape-determining protein [Pyrinomonadaceae bacterium]